LSLNSTPRGTKACNATLSMVELCSIITWPQHVLWLWQH
jgi:hypothetical protein